VSHRAASVGRPGAFAFPESRFRLRRVRQLNPRERTDNDRRPIILRTLDALLTTILVIVGWAVTLGLPRDGFERVVVRDSRFWLFFFLPAFLPILITSLIARQNRLAALTWIALMAFLLLVFLLTPRGVE
jgi:hypothetical protein